MKAVRQPFYNSYALFTGNPTFGNVQNNIMVYDRNPEWNDCAVYALSIALNKSYKSVYKDLKDIVKKKIQNNPYKFKYNPEPKNGVEENVVYDYIREFQWKRYKLLKPISLKKLSVRNHNTIIAGITGHLSVVKDKCVYDSYDSRRQQVKVIYLRLGM